MRALLLSGGGFKGAFQLPILEHLMSKHEYDVILGVSVGSINGVLAAQHQLSTLRHIWERMDDPDPIDGIRGFLSVAVQRWKGLYSLNPLRRQLERTVDPSKFIVKYGCGYVVRQTGEYRQPVFGEHDSPAVIISSIIASSAVAGIMEPEMVGSELRSDGGHLHPIPLPPDDKDITDIDVVSCHPLEHHYSTGEVNGLFDALDWAFEIQMASQSRADIEALSQLAESEGKSITVYAPSKPLGGMLQASRKVIQARMAAGLEAVKHPIPLR